MCRAQRMPLARTPGAANVRAYVSRCDVRRRGPERESARVSAERRAGNGRIRPADARPEPVPLVCERKRLEAAGRLREVLCGARLDGAAAVPPGLRGRGREPTLCPTDLRAAQRASRMLGVRGVRDVQEAQFPEGGARGRAHQEPAPAEGWGNRQVHPRPARLVADSVKSSGAGWMPAPRFCYGSIRSCRRRRRCGRLRR